MQPTPSPRRRLAGAVVVACATACFVVATAAAVPIRGTLEVPRDYTPPARAENAPAPFYWEEWNGVLDPKPHRLDVRREIAVAVVGQAEGWSAPASVVKLQGGGLMPSTIVVQAGSTLRIENTDGCAHELFSEGIEGFGPLQTAPGNARTITLPAQAGTHEIRDRLYPHVLGHVHVLPNLLARATVGADGRYELGDVPQGTHTLEVFHAARQVHSRQVEVAREITLDPVPLNLAAAAQ